MAFCVGRLICRRLLLSGGSCSRMMMSTAIIPNKNNNNNNANSFSSSPLLMLPPKLNDDNNSITYDFYSLAENRLLFPRPHIGLTMMPKPIHDLSYCGSSHGWLALSNPDTLELVLYDPISHRHINLPPIPNSPEDDYDQNWRVTKLILSSSDLDHNSCRAVMIYSCGNLAFCCPSCPSKEWTLLDSKTGYYDIVYSRKQNLFFANKQAIDQLETWDFSNPSSPKMIDAVDYKYNRRVYMEMSPRERMLRPTIYLVDADGVILFVTRYVMNDVAPDGSYVEYYTYPSLSTPFCPHMTIDFDIQVYDQEGKTLKEEPRRSLGDLALFIGGQADSVALSATRFPELKPNSIYFTDPYPTRYDPDNELLVGGHDIGIFDFEKKTVSPCYYPRDLRSLKRLMPSPVWFFPRGEEDDDDDSKMDPSF